MEFSNFNTSSIPSKVVAEVIQSLDNINKKLPGRAALTKEEKDALTHMDKEEPFIMKVLHEAEANPELVPPGFDLDELRRNVELIKAAQMILDPLKKLVQKLEDSALVAGSEAYVPSLFLYNVMKSASKYSKKTSKTAFIHQRNLLRKDLSKTMLSENMA